MPQQQRNTRERERIDLREPSRYNVILHNDDFTPMDFVVWLLTTIFFKPKKEATEIMLNVHNEGKGIVGPYTYDVAHSKVEKATAISRNNNFPLRLTVEPAED